MTGDCKSAPCPFSIEGFFFPPNYYSTFSRRLLGSVGRASVPAEDAEDQGQQWRAAADESLRGN